MATLPAELPVPLIPVQYRYRYGILWIAWYRYCNLGCLTNIIYFMHVHMDIKMVEPEKSDSGGAKVLSPMTTIDNIIIWHPLWAMPVSGCPNDSSIISAATATGR